jgi:pimeloyl-ACP methyl ester carboxylesterase
VSKRGTAGIIGGAIGVAAATAVVVAFGKEATARRATTPEQVAEQFARLPFDRNGFVPADDGTGLYYEEVGPRDAPLTVLFVHGYTLNSASFYFQRIALQQEFGDGIRAVYYDHRSHGRSDRSDAAHSSIAQLARDLQAVIEAVAPAGPVVLVGHSMGGMTVLGLAGHRPHLFGAGGPVAAVALMSTSAGKMAGVTLGLPALLAKVGGPIMPFVLRGARSQARLVERGRALGTDVAWIITRRMSFAGGDVDAATVEYLSAMIAATRIEVIADFYPAVMSHDQTAAVPALSHLPVLILCGDHDLLTPLSHSKELARLLPEADLVVVESAGHVVQLERPNIVDDSLIALIRKVMS